MQRIFSGLVLLLMAWGSADAALLSRMAGQAYYDDVVDITWIADANLAYTTNFGVVGINANGSMTWAKANEWIAAMNTAAYLGNSDWRLPNVTDTGTSGCDFAFTGTDCGFNVDLSTGEMAHMYYSTLGNLAYFSTSGVAQQDGWGLPNTGPFANLQRSHYWSGPEYVLNTSNAWTFGFGLGNQAVSDVSTGFHAWAVRPGDIAPVPVPGAAWLFGGALAVFGTARRRAMTTLG